MRRGGFAAVLVAAVFAFGGAASAAEPGAGGTAGPDVVEAPSSTTETAEDAERSVPAVPSAADESGLGGDGDGDGDGDGLGGPRRGFGLGMGLGFGFDGGAAVVLSWLGSEQVAVEVAIGVLFPVMDVRVRWLGLRERLTPVVGFGMTTPYGDADRLELGLDMLSSLYALGGSIHVDLGLSWAATGGLELFVGVAFVTPLDRDHPDTVLFFPQLAAQALWYF